MAMWTLSVVYNRILDIRRFSHTLDHVGDKMTSPILDDLIKGWISPFSHSCKAKLAWKTQTGLSIPTYSPTR